jgi:hypothetical protein
MVQDLEKLVSDPRFQVSFKSPEQKEDFESEVFDPWKEVLIAQRIESKYVETLVREDTRFASLPNDLDIFSAIREADVIISNGSNVLFEGLICEKPGINITNWLHPVGERGELSRKPCVDFAGILSGNSQDLPKLIDLALSVEFSPLIKEGKSRIVSAHTLGKASHKSAELIIDSYREILKGELPQISTNFPRASKNLDKSELELAQIKILQKNAEGGKFSDSSLFDRAVAERDRAVAERDSVFNSTVWKLTKPYRKLRSLF